MSDYEKSACAVKPPMEGNISVLAITSSASAVQDSGVSDGSPKWVTVVASVDSFITFGSNGTNTVTDPDGTATSTGARTWPLAAGVPQPFLVNKTSRYFKVRGSAAGYCRWYVSSW